MNVPSIPPGVTSVLQPQHYMMGNPAAAAAASLNPAFFGLPHQAHQPNQGRRLFSDFWRNF